MYVVRHTHNVLRSMVRPTVMSSSNPLRNSSTSTMHENDPELLEREKHRNLSGSQHKTSTPHEKDAPGWNEYLASASEANVKADKSTTSPEDLQSQTVRYVKARHVVDMEGAEENTRAYYTHDTVTGPLSGAEGKEEVHIYDGQVLKGGPIPDSVASELARKMQPTESEEDVSTPV
ncbi:hypothetical protein AN958_09062 [Leucoagaricus sp. SymC.cos]|nr:hypothetical protein AN958_12189 [Leucoagaricus sp. SymC.cos]KXN92962.1 hypothetical protein AN958_09062 [Leucoagaricus sp. SymC.cos]